ncbi:unnamed protein product [Cyberlindnera jadinii]|uniref:Uncharacterized protein n=1 Tax=Cyberlindnera jadinii (strain ATCC 18201 / CBS 1600 / BCRC 20928 / JCM 3617 / NBRC 0987 / NRRL Y-1542) TaxID=983966 RepID=A0A0H5C3R4_CYBJN|nr:unnamed protein product [Cyberlindnera jadinii]
MLSAIIAAYPHQHHQNISSSTQQRPVLQQPLSALPVRSAYYESHGPLFCSDWKPTEQHSFHTIAVSSYREHSYNKIEIVEASPELVEQVDGNRGGGGLSLKKFADATVDLPVTKLQWDPSGSNKLVTTTNVLTVWELSPDNRLVAHSTVANKGDDLTRASHPPLTSFDWNKVNPNLIITSSIDTTCTVWDLHRPIYPKTQLIAHDSEVFDVAFIKGSTDIFASVGHDGSVRMFDLRCLEHSTIVYEPRGPEEVGAMPGKTNDMNSLPLLRLATSNTDSNVMATFVGGSDSIAIIDMRYPGYASSMLKGHSSPLNSIQWHPSQSKLLSGADDCQALVWDLKESRLRNGTGLPSGVYGDMMEINNVSWSSDGEWFGVVAGKGLQAVRV